MNDAHGTRSLREIARILFQHWFMLLMILGVGTVGTWFYCEIVAEKKYRSRVSLIFKRPLNKSPITSDSGERALEVFVKAQQQIVMSDQVLARTRVVAGDPQLFEQWVGLRDRKASVEEASQFIQAHVQEKARKLLTAEQEEFERFRRSIDLETPGGEQVAMTESFTLIVDRPGEPSDARNAADVLADMYLHRFQVLQQELNDPAVAVMDEVIAEYNAQVQDRLDAYNAFISEHPADVGVLEQLLKSGNEHGVQILLSKIRENDAELRVKLARDEALLAVLESALPSSENIEAMSLNDVTQALRGAPADFLEDNVAIVELMKVVAKMEGKRASLETQFTEDSRELQYVIGEIDRGRRRLLEAIVAQAASLRANVEARNQQLAKNAELMKESAAERNAIHKKLVQYARLKNEFEVAQAHLAGLRRERNDAMSNKLRAREAVTISKLNEASLPSRDNPLSPKTLLYTFAAFLASGLLGVALAFFLDHFDHTLRSSVEAERYLGVPVLGSVKKRGRRLVVT